MVRSAALLCAVSLLEAVAGSALDNDSTAPTTIFGSVYVQGGGLGVASYHFQDPDDCYISYENAPSSWKLDNGESPPAVKPFDSPLFDAASRTFTGVVDWSPTTFGGDARWEYTMVFSDDFGYVFGGEVRAFDASGEQTYTLLFGIDLHYGLYVGSNGAVGSDGATTRSVALVTILLGAAFS